MAEIDDQNLDPAFRASELIVKYLEDSLLEDEPQELDSWIEESDSHRVLFSELTDPVRLNESLTEYYNIDKDKKATLRKLKRRLSIGRMIFGFVPLIVLRYVAVAAFVGGLIFTGIYISRQTRPVTPSSGFAKKEKTIVPGDGNQVVLTLANGSKIQLDSSGNGLLAQEGGVEVLKQKDGQVIYNANKQGGGPVSMNSIQTPRGRMFEVVLPDGSRVTMNALTKLNYPTAFTGSKRSVTLSEGEAYFQVVNKKNQMPFEVGVAGMSVTVTGTEFNINAYKNETVVKSTLFEGGVKITKDAVEIPLKPGQQVMYDSVTKNFKLIPNADLDATSAWRMNLFNLDNTDIPTLMREISRWFDVDVVYANEIPKGHFEGQIPRNMDFAELIRVLNEGGIKTKLEGRKLIVL